jgi:hypothetical protein
MKKDMTVLEWKNGNQDTSATVDPEDTLSFSPDMIAEFWRNFYPLPQHKGLRIGQAFHQFFSLHKVQGVNKVECNKLYQLDGERARAWIKQHTAQY